jgi:hypothetical protein
VEGRGCEGKDASRIVREDESLVDLFHEQFSIYDPRQMADESYGGGSRLCLGIFNAK